MDARSESDRFSIMLSMVQTGDIMDPGVPTVDDLELQSRRLVMVLMIIIHFTHCWDAPKFKEPRRYVLTMIIMNGIWGQSGAAARERTLITLAVARLISSV